MKPLKNKLESFRFKIYSEIKSMTNEGITDNVWGAYFSLASIRRIYDTTHRKLENE